MAETWKERVSKAEGKYLIYCSEDKDKTTYHSYMENCHLRDVNKEGSVFTLVETDNKGSYTFHFNSLFITDISYYTYLSILLNKDYNLVGKIKALVKLYRLWNKSRIIKDE